MWDFIFNLGADRYKYSILRRCVDAEEWKKPLYQCTRWIYAGG
ncbi:hypothetical protein [Candidatus Liberibacter solanacearum]